MSLLVCGSGALTPEMGAELQAPNPSALTHIHNTHPQKYIIQSPGQYLRVGVPRDLDLHGHARPPLLLLRRLLLVALLVSNQSVVSVDQTNTLYGRAYTQQPQPIQRTVAFTIASLMAAAPSLVKAPQRSALA